MFDLHHPIIDAEVILTSHHSVHSVVGRACAFFFFFFKTEYQTFVAFFEWKCKRSSDACVIIQKKEKNMTLNV